MRPKPGVRAVDPLSSFSLRLSGLAWATRSHLLPHTSPAFAVGEDEEGGEGGGEGHQGEDQEGFQDLEAELQEEQHQGQPHRRSHRDGDPLCGAQGGEHGWRGLSLSGC